MFPNGEVDADYYGEQYEQHNAHDYQPILHDSQNHAVKHSATYAQLVIRISQLLWWENEIRGKIRNNFPVTTFIALFRFITYGMCSNVVKIRFIVKHERILGLRWYTT